ncbi:MAG TPA: hypothetical protein VKB36_07035, partial [Vicinamibacterales bacterium]|nr:hypothetical protein [Vicinamibacterales bacterium]
QTTAATAEESAAASEELNAQAEQSMAAVRRLEVLVNGKTASGGTGITGKSVRRTDTADKLSSGQDFHPELTTDIPSAYMRTTAAPPAEQDATRQAG